MSDRQRDPAVTDEYQPPYLAAGIAALGVFALYAITLSPTTWFWDTSEYIATAHVMGIPHPPGNPLFVLLARTWDILLSPFGLSTAVRINLFSATMSALAHGCWFLVADRILAFQSTDRVFRRIGAAAAVLVSATAYTVWNQSNVNEKVYTVSLLTIALLSFLAFRWRDTVRSGRDGNLLLLMVFILALSVSNHLMAFLAAPAIVVFVLLVQPRTFTNRSLYATALLAVAVGLSVQLFLPIRAGLDPVLNEGDPVCGSLVSALGSALTMGKAGCAELSQVIAREQYGKPSVLVDPVMYAQGVLAPRSPALVLAQVANYFQYFDWQWSRSVLGNVSWFAGPRSLITLLFLAIGGFGALSGWKNDRRSFAYIAVLFVTLSFGLTFYLNFKYGFTSPWSDGTNTEVRERDYFFLVSFSIWGVWVGTGLAGLWYSLSSWLKRRRMISGTPTAVNAPAFRPSWAAAPVMLIALIPLLMNWSWASRRGDYTARDWAYNLLMSVEPYGVLFTNGDNDTFPLWYLQAAEGIRQDVTVVVLSYLNTDWYAKQLRDLTKPCAPGESAANDPTRITCQRPYVAPDGVTLYHTAATPAKSILPFSDADIARISQTGWTRAPELPFRAGKIASTIENGTLLSPSDYFMAGIITAAIEDRPIYFAMTTQAFDTLKLRPYLLRQGVASKLNNGPLADDPANGIAELGPEYQQITRFVDVQRTDTLLNDVYIHRGGFPDDWTRWPDAGTENVPAFYAATYTALAAAYHSDGLPRQTEDSIRNALRFSRLANLRLQATTE